VIKIGVVGCGAIGSELCRAADEMGNIQLVALIDRKEGYASDFASSLRSKPAVVGIDEMVEMVDLVVECASRSAVKSVAVPVLKRGKSIMIMSVGALLDEDLFEEIKRLAEKNNCKVYIPSGAIVGLDGLKAARLGNIKSVKLRSMKPITAFESLAEGTLKEEEVLFRGNAEEAVKLFPKNVNVAASIRIVGGERTTVEVVANPTLRRNVHELEVVGDFGRFVTRVENVPSPSNPKTSYIAVLSAIATLKRISEPIQIGT
jgi:aspartate dehydrogenase